MFLITKPLKELPNTVYIPGDKSISHRSIMFSALAEGTSYVYNFLMSEDCLNTINCFKQLGVDINVDNSKITIVGKGLHGLSAPASDLYVGNSGTTIRLMLGILCGQPFETTLYGDSSIGKRPMDRVMIPLSKMGAKFKAIEDKFTPITTVPVPSLTPIQYNSHISSAQVKSAVLLAGLYCDGTTSFIEPLLSRDHTERMLKRYGVTVERDNLKASIKGGQSLKPCSINVPGDISSAAFFMVLAAISPNTKLTVKNVGINPTRTGILDVLKMMGAKMQIDNIQDVEFEPHADITVETSELKATTIGGSLIPRLIDEIPIIAIAACFAEGTTIIKDAEELKVKESNRIKSMVDNLTLMGADIQETDDGMIINGKCTLIGSDKLKAYNDHRIAMSLIIAALNATGDSAIDSIESISTSFPNFLNILGLN